MEKEDRLERWKVAHKGREKPEGAMGIGGRKQGGILSGFTDFQSSQVFHQVGLVLMSLRSQ